MNLASILERFDAVATARDWHRLHTPRNLATALTVEAAELLTLFQWQPDGDVMTPALREAAAAEAADVLMYLVAFCDRAGIDLPQAVEAKQRANASRFLGRVLSEPSQ